MEENYSIPLTKVADEFQLEFLYRATDVASVRVRVEDVSRPGIQLTGYFEHFERSRLQVFGKVELGYLAKMTEQEQRSVLDSLFSYKFPALLIARNLEPGEVCLEMAKKYDVSVLRTSEPTSSLVSALIAYLRNALAPRITRHGVLMEVYGEGILLMGESGMGKSEAAIELLKRGHRLIADDAVEIRKISNDTIIGTAPAVIRNFVELRGIGIINVAQLFGMGAVKEQNEINLVVNIVPWNNHTAYDRLGVEVQHTELLGVKVPQNTIPITPGRNLAVILEVAAMNNRQRRMGFNAALDFTAQFNSGN